jgi:3-deoxy-7-phosphoheptulonate synthase
MPPDSSWTPSSWRERPIRQQPRYASIQALDEVLGTIRTYPPLVFVGEIRNLRRQLAEAARGGRFLLQGGDCAERFLDCTPEAITSKIKILLQMSVIFSYGARRPVVRIGRIAGQYAKPRSSEVETVGGREIPVFRGDNINSFIADPQLRQPDPSRLLQSYHTAAMTLNYIRALIAGGFADLHYPENWNLSFVTGSPQRERYEQIVSNIQDAVAFMESFGGLREERLGSIDFFTSHEGLLLGFEEAMTRRMDDDGRHYNLGAHMLWIGDRTRGPGEAHVEYFRGIANPIGIKWGPSADPREMVDTIRRLDPEGEPGRVTVITRFGDEAVGELLPRAVEAVAEAGLPVLWVSDPMHGNVVRTAGGTKTRSFDAILGELRQSFEIHARMGGHLGGVHFEMTGEDVTECTGGSGELAEADLARQYETLCDPRLNCSQSLEMAFLISSILKNAPARRQPSPPAERIEAPGTQPGAQQRAEER